MPEQIQDIIAKVMAGSHDVGDLQAIARAIKTGQINLVFGEGAVGVGRDAVNSLIVPGSGNFIGNTFVIPEEAVATIQALLTQQSRLTQSSVIPLAELVQQVRSHTSAKILNLFSKIQLLNKRQVEVDRLYVDVYVLEMREFRATIPGLLEGQDAREQFDRLGLGKRGERSQGLAIAASEHYPRLIVLGKPGSGKSTFLRHLAVSCAKGEFLGNSIPILLELRDVDEATFSLFRCIHWEFELEQEAQTEQILKRGQVLILLDGLDEMPSSLRQTVQNELRKFAKRYDRNRFILTCRTQTTECIPEQFQAVEVADFKPEQVECFALNWFTAMAGTLEQGAALKDHFMEKLRESPQTAELAVTPVLLSLTCWIFDDLQCLPQKRSDLYRDGLDLLLQQWDEGRGISRDSEYNRYRQLTTEERKRLLSYLAVRKFEQAENFVLFEESELCGYIAECLQISVEESRSVLRAIAQYGLLIERAQGIWSFSHLTFQEYLVAKWFCDRADWRSLVEHITENYWQEVFYLAVGMLNEADELVQCTKFQIDQLLSGNAQLQEYLAWVSEKSNSVDTNEISLPVIRAFYFSFALDRVFLAMHGYTEFLHLSLAISLDHNFDYRLNDDLYFDATIHRSNNIDLIALQKISQNLTQDFQSEFQLLINTFPKLPVESEEFQQWWQKDGEVWAEKFWLIMMQYRKIRRKWNFDEHEKKLLEQYNNANELLVNCLRSGCNLNYKIERKIKEALLLPIAEIEERKNQSLD